MIRSRTKPRLREQGVEAEPGPRVTGPAGKVDATVRVGLRIAEFRCDEVVDVLTFCSSREYVPDDLLGRVYRRRVVEVDLQRPYPDFTRPCPEPVDHHVTAELRERRVIVLRVGVGVLTLRVEEQLPDRLPDPLGVPVGGDGQRFHRV